MPVPAALFAVLLALATAYHVRRLVLGVRSRRFRLDIDLSHILMGLTMTAMLLDLLPRAAASWLVACFAPAAVWFTVVAVRRYVLDGPGRVGREAVQAVGCAAMAFMLAPAAGLHGPTGPATAAALGPTAMPGMAMPGTAFPGGPPLAGLLLAAVTAAAAWTLWTLWAPAIPGHVRRSVRGPVAAGCQMAMNAAAAYMLVAVL